MNAYTFLMNDGEVLEGRGTNCYNAFVCAHSGYSWSDMEDWEPNQTLEKLGE